MSKLTAISPIDGRYQKQTASLGTYYDQFWDAEKQEHELVVNPNELSDLQLQNDPRIVHELGKHYQYESRCKTIYDIAQKRLSYSDENAIYKNYGLKGWALFDGTKPCVISTHVIGRR